jgi:GMP synthase (glutamine-hydrolysing)
MEEDRLRTDFWLMAQIRQSMANGIPMVVIAKGDAVGGAVLIKLNQFEAGCTVFSQTRDGEGNRAWLRATGPEPILEADADSFIARQRGYDSDLWVVEIEDRQGRLPFTEPIL